MQHFKTITRTRTNDVESVHYTVAHAVLENCQKQVANTCFDYDSTGCRYYIQLTQILASLTQTYYDNADDDYLPLCDLMHCFSHLTYYDDKCIYDDCVKNTALESVNFYDYNSLSN